MIEESKMFENLYGRDDKLHICLFSFYVMTPYNGTVLLTGIFHHLQVIIMNIGQHIIFGDNYKY